MSAPLSVVIPTLGSADTIGPCLGALGEAVMSGLIREVILADGGSGDAIADIADATGAELINSPPGRGIQLQAGADAAKGDWLMFVHSDTILSDGWVDAVRRHIQAHPKHAGYFALRFNSTGLMPRITASWANLRSRLFGLPYGDQGLLISRAHFCRVGGYPPIPIMEDVALARRLRGSLRRLDAVATTSPERYERDGWVRRGGRNLYTLALYFLGVPPAKLVTTYQRG